MVIVNLLGAWSSGSSITYVNPSSSQTLSGSGVIPNLTFPQSALFFLNVAQVSPSSSHTLDVYVQHSPDNGTTYDDFAHFIQVPGKTPATATQIAQWVRDSAPSSSAVSNFTSVRTPATQALAAGLVMQGPVGPMWRAQAVATGASSSTPWRVTLHAWVGADGRS